MENGISVGGWDLEFCWKKHGISRVKVHSVIHVKKKKKTSTLQILIMSSGKEIELETFLRFEFLDRVMARNLITFDLMSIKSWIIWRSFLGFHLLFFNFYDLNKYRVLEFSRNSIT